MISLSKYITSWIFLQEFDLQNKFDVVIFEKKIPDDIDSSKFNCVSILDIGLDLQPEWLITSFFDDYENPLFIMDELPIDTFYQVLDEYFGKITVINCNTWLSSYYSKTNPETNDITFANELEMEIFEPFDKMSLKQLLIQETKNEIKTYIKLANKDYPKSLLEENQIENLTNNKNNKKKDLFPAIIDLTSKQDEIVENTILCSWSILPETVQTAKLLQEEHGQLSDIFLALQRNGEWTKSFITHCKKTWNLIIICDQEYNHDLKMFFEIQRKKTDLDNVSIQIVCPNLDKISTVLQEYIYEQAEFDADGIIKKIIKNN